jgi:hypothetical protein
VAYKVHGQKAFPCVAIDWLCVKRNQGYSKVLPWQGARKQRGRIARSRPKAGNWARPSKAKPHRPRKKAKGAPEDALQKLEKLVRARHCPLALKDLVMKAHVPFPFDSVETLRLRSAI